MGGKLRVIVGGVTTRGFGMGRSVGVVVTPSDVVMTFEASGSNLVVRTSGIPHLTVALGKRVSSLVGALEPSVSKLPTIMGGGRQVGMSRVPQLVSGLLRYQDGNGRTSPQDCLMSNDAIGGVLGSE